MCALLDARSSEADYAQRRTTALLSATLHSRLGSLASLSLKDPAAIGFEYDLVDGQMVVRKAPGQQAQQQAQAQAAAGGGGDAAAWAAATAAAWGAAGAAVASLEQFEIPAQLKQRFVEVRATLRLCGRKLLVCALPASSLARDRMPSLRPYTCGCWPLHRSCIAALGLHSTQPLHTQVPCKLRLVALAALLRARLAAAPGSCKMVVFLSTTDSVEFYHSGALREQSQ